MKKKSSDNNLLGTTVNERIVIIYGQADTRVRPGLSWAEDVADFYMEIYPDFFESGATTQMTFSPFDGEEWLESYWD